MAIYTKLMDHQVKIVKFCKDKNYFAIFADYGVGKTLCALAYIQLNKLTKTLVVSTKTSILTTWPDEIKKHSNFNFVILTGTRKQKLDALYRGLKMARTGEDYYSADKKHPTLFLINFEGIKNIYHDIVLANMDCMLVDESTKIKSHKADRTKVACRLGEEIDRKFIMTGFPITEQVADLYSQIKFIDEGETFGKNYYAFLNTYFVRAGCKRVPKRKAVHNILKAIKPFTIRVSNDVLDLPPKSYKIIHIPMSPQQKKMIYELNEYFQLELKKFKIDIKYVFTLLNKSLQICDGFIKGEGKQVELVKTHKDEALMNTLEEINVKKNKVIIWFHFTLSLRKIQRILNRMDIKTMALYGNVDVVSSVKKFMHTKDHNVLLATQKKAAPSLNLANCRYAIYYSNNWSYEDRSNSEARIRRKGSEKHSSIIYTDLLVKDSVEEKVYECLKTKKRLIDMIKQEFIDVGSIV